MKKIHDYSIPETPKNALPCVVAPIPQAPNIATPRYAFTREEAAKVLGVSPATIDRLTKRGLLRPSRAIRRPLYSSEELQRFMRETTGKIELHAEGRALL